MKTPKEIFNEMSIGLQTSTRWINIIKNVQVEAWNEALERKEMKTLVEERELARKIFDEKANTKYYPHAWIHFWAGWLESAYERAYKLQNKKK